MLTDKRNPGGTLTVQCDETTCTTELETNQSNPAAAFNYAISFDWFVEKTSSKTFCPDHAPRPGVRHDDNVDHPAHYNVGKIEVIDAIEDWQLGFHEGNVVKYVARAKHKGKELEDLKKAAWYLNRRIAELEAEPTKGQRGYNEG